MLGAPQCYDSDKVGSFNAESHDEERGNEALNSQHDLAKIVIKKRIIAIGVKKIVVCWLVVQNCCQNAVYDENQRQKHVNQVSHSPPPLLWYIGRWLWRERFLGVDVGVVLFLEARPILRFVELAKGRCIPFPH